MRMFVVVLLVVAAGAQTKPQTKTAAANVPSKPFACETQYFLPFQWSPFLFPTPLYQLTTPHPPTDHSLLKPLEFKRVDPVPLAPVVVLGHDCHFKEKPPRFNALYGQAVEVQNADWATIPALVSGPKSTK